MAFHPLLLLSLSIAVTYFNIFINFPLSYILHASFLISSLNTYLDHFPLAFLSSDLTCRQSYYFPSHFLSLCFICNTHIKKKGFIFLLSQCLHRILNIFLHILPKYWRFISFFDSLFSHFCSFLILYNSIFAFPFDHLE